MGRGGLPGPGAGCGGKARHSYFLDLGGGKMSKEKRVARKQNNLEVGDQGEAGDEGEIFLDSRGGKLSKERKGWPESKKVGM